MRAGVCVGACVYLELTLALEEELLPLLFRDEVHLVDEAEDPRALTVLPDRGEADGIVLEILCELAALNVEHVDEHLDIPGRKKGREGQEKRWSDDE